MLFASPGILRPTVSFFCSVVLVGRERRQAIWRSRGDGRRLDRFVM